MNETEIVILGGNDGRNDVVLYDPTENTWETVIYINYDDEGYCGTSNISACIDDDHVVFLAHQGTESN